MMSKLIPIMKVLAALDGAVCTLAGGIAMAYPSAAPTCHAIIVAGGSVGTILGAVAKLVSPAPAAS